VPSSALSNAEAYSIGCIASRTPLPMGRSGQVAEQS